MNFNAFTLSKTHFMLSFIQNIINFVGIITKYCILNLIYCQYENH